MIESNFKISISAMILSDTQIRMCLFAAKHD